MNLALLFLLTMFSGISHARTCSKLETFIKSLQHSNRLEKLDQRLLEALVSKEKLSVEEVYLAQSIDRKINLSTMKGSTAPAEVNPRYERLKPVFKDIDEANNLGYELQDLEDKLRELTDPKNFTGGGADEVRLRILELRKKITVINDKYVEKMHRLYQDDGIPSMIVEHKNGFKMLKLDFTKVPEKHHAFNFFRRINKASGLDQITVSLQETAETGFGGIFIEAPRDAGAVQRMELGFGQGFELLDGMVGQVGKHESRHAVFFAKRSKGLESIYHTRFNASASGNLLNENKIYDSYMSAEEIYTYSTDMKAATSLFRRPGIEKADLFQYLKSSNSQFRNILLTNQGITEKVLQNLDAVMSRPMLPEDWNVFETAPGKYAMKLQDSLGRSATLKFISPREASVVEKAFETKALTAQHMESAIKAQGWDQAEFIKAIQAGEPEKVAFVQLKTKEFLSTTQASDAEKAVKAMFEMARERLQKLNSISKTQLAESQKLDELIRVSESSPNGGSIEQILRIREHLYKIGKNVNEDFKGRALK